MSSQELNEAADYLVEHPDATLRDYLVYHHNKEKRFNLSDKEKQCLQFYNNLVGRYFVLEDLNKKVKSVFQITDYDEPVGGFWTKRFYEISDDIYMENGIFMSIQTESFVSEQYIDNPYSENFNPHPNVKCTEITETQYNSVVELFDEMVSIQSNVYKVLSNHDNKTK
jgi:CRISPR/Cas system-associated protein endoribonuclease Cas2